MSDTSIRTPAWGVTTRVKVSLMFCNDFNSHPRVGGDSSEAHHLNRDVISIRTPAWG